MRGLELQDVFSMSRIISKLDIAEEMKLISDKAQKGEKVTEAIGIEFLLTLLGKASNKEVEKELYAFFSDVAGMKIEDIRHMKPKDFIELVKGADASEWRDFFTSVMGLITKNY